MHQPNLLFILTDQQSAGALSCVGNPHLQTPNLDRLAAMGVRFENAYCTQPLCVPSRSSLVSGRMPHEVGVPINLRENEAAARVPWMSHVLSEAGYQTCWIGKWHLPVATDKPELHGFDQTHCRRVGDADVPRLCAEFLEGERATPFLLVASFVNPHDICEWARGDRLPYGAIGEAPPPDKCPPLPANFAVAPDEPSALCDTVRPFSPRVYPTDDWDEGRWRQYLWAYGRLVEKVDAQIGELLDALEASGHAKDTVVIFSSDHGDGMAAHGWNQKQVLWEEVVRVPLIIRDPAAQQPGHTDAHLVSMNLDLLPTLCDYAQAAPPSELCGRSLRPLVENRAPDDWRDFVFVETEFCVFDSSSGVQGRAARSRRYKYIVYSRGERREQLFDLERDPGEMRNLANDLAYAAITREHRQRLQVWLDQVGDNFPLATIAK